MLSAALTSSAASLACRQPPGVAPAPCSAHPLRSARPGQPTVAGAEVSPAGVLSVLVNPPTVIGGPGGKARTVYTCCRRAC